MSILIGMESAVRSLRAHTTAMNTVSHNIANAENPDYSRQLANLSTTTPLSYYGEAGQIGTGTQVGSISRIRDIYLDRQIQRELHDLGKWYVLNNAYERIKVHFPEVNDPTVAGLNNQMDEFFQTWGALSAAIDSGGSIDTELNNVLDNAKVLTQMFRDKASSLVSLQIDLNAEMRMMIDDVNSIVKKIYELNKEIAFAYGKGMRPNDLLDKRTAALAELSEYVNFSTGERTDGSLVLHIQGHTLIDGVEKYNEMTYIAGTKDSKFEGIGLFESGMRPVDITRSIFGGKLGGVLQARDEVIPFYRLQLDMLAHSLKTVVNEIYQASDPNKDFFFGDTAMSFRVNPQISRGNDIEPIKLFELGAKQNNIAEVIASLDSKLMSTWITSSRQVMDLAGNFATTDTLMADLVAGMTPASNGEIIINGITIGYSGADTLGDFINNINDISPQTFMAVFNDKTNEFFMVVNDSVLIQEMDGYNLIDALNLIQEQVSAAPVNYPQAIDGVIEKRELNPSPPPVYNYFTWDTEKSKFFVEPYAPEGRDALGNFNGRVILRYDFQNYEIPWGMPEEIMITLPNVMSAGSTPTVLSTFGFPDSEQKVHFGSGVENTGTGYELKPFSLADKSGNLVYSLNFIGNVRFGRFYDYLIGTLDGESRNANDILGEYTAVIQQLQQVQENITKVDIEEELARARAYQRAYDASVKLLSIIDQMLNMLINRTATPSDSWNS